MVSRPTTRAAGSRPLGAAGFTMVEVLIALTVLLIGIAGLLSMHVSSMRASSFSRHATEASTLAEDKMEELRTVAVAALVSGTDTVDPRGVADAAGPYTRVWTPTVDGATGDTIVLIEVTWTEQGGEDYTVEMRTVRN